MAVGCTECKNWEEEVYWSRFGTVQFCQFLTARFDQQLAIPKKFVNNLREKMVGTVVLKGPSGKIWNVGLEANGDTLYFKEGWKKFVEDHSLEENDTLFFRYNGNSRFDVFMFDKELCERAACYFIRKCEHADSSPGSKRKRSLEESSKEMDEKDESSDSDVEESRPKKPRNSIARTPRSRNRSTTRSTTPRGRRGPRRGKQRSRSVQLKSRRRGVTAEQKEGAQKMALEASSENSFIVVMRASHVYSGFFMSIPVEWARVHLPSRSQKVVLRMKDKTWEAKYHFKGNSGGLVGGWKNFVMENFLEEFDVCVFDFVKGSPEHNFIFDVKIFRVVEKVIPPTHVNSRGASMMSTEYVQDSSEEEEEKGLPLSLLGK